MYRVLGLLGAQTASWKPGAVVRAIITAAAVFGAAISELVAAIAKSGWLELCSGPWLDLVAWYVYRVTRAEATYAEQYVDLTNAGGGDFDWAPSEFVMSHVTTGKTYRNVLAISLRSVGTPQATARALMRAVESGSGSNANPGTVTVINVPDSNVTATHTAAFIGLDEEDDPQLKIRCYESTASISPNGPREVYATIAKNATRTDGTRIGVTRVRINSSSDNGNVTVVCALASGALSDPDLARVQELLRAYAEPHCVTVTALNSVPVNVLVSFEIWAYSDAGLSDTQWTDLVALKLSSYIASQPIGGNLITQGASTGYVYTSALSGVVKGAREEIFRVMLSGPTSDVALTYAQVPQYVPASGTVHQVAR